MPNANKFQTAVITYANKLGYTVVKTKSGHLRFKHATTAKLVFAASTPSCHRAEQNVKHILKRNAK